MTSVLAGCPAAPPGGRADGAAPTAVHGLPSVVLARRGDADAAADALHDGALQALVVARYAADAAVRGG
jgi:hypothetical protein